MSSNDTEIVAAAVDIGTNSVKIVVAASDAATGRPRVLFEATKNTRLGKSVDANGRLDPEAVRRTLDALKGFADEAKRHSATRIAAVGTSALRDAANGADFVREAEKTLGGKVEVISGEREAQLVYTAARRDPDLGLQDGTRLIATIDIGGGSTEFVLGRGTDDIAYRASLQLGAVRLTERTLPSDPPTPEEMARAVALADALLADVPLPDGPVTVVGSGGTFANLAAMEKRLTEFTPNVLHGLTLSRERIEARIATLASQTLAARRETVGLEPERADVIVGGAIIAVRALHRLGASEAVVSVRGLRYGLLYELLDSEG